MKKYSLVLLGMIINLFISCNNNLGSWNHPDIAGSNPDGGYVCFFQFEDTSYMNNIIVWHYWNEKEDFMSKYGTKLSSKYWIPLFPENLEGQAMFGERLGGKTNMNFDYLDGCFYTIDDLVQNPKFIALKGGYYICYPFTALELHGHYLDAEWKDFYDINFSQIDIIPSHHVYKKRYHISELILANLTQKSTKHFPRNNEEMITIDDVVTTLNRLIETNKIDEYCYQVYN